MRDAQHCKIVRGGRTRTATLRLDDDQLRLVDEAAGARKVSRGRFLELAVEAQLATDGWLPARIKGRADA